MTFMSSCVTGTTSPKNREFSPEPITKTQNIMTYEEIIKSVENGAKFTINFQKRTCRLNGKLVDLSEVELPDVEMPVMAWIEILYKYYKRSIPSERSESHRRCYFKAKAEREISDEDMMYGEPREPMRCRLELFVLLSIYHGKLTWHDE